MASSGTFTGSRGGGSDGPYLKLTWSELSQDVANNKTQLRLTLSLVVDTSISFSSDKTGSLDGTSFTYTSGFSGSGTKTLKTLDKWFTHNSDGTLTVALDGQFSIAISYSGSTVSSLGVSGNAVLDTIPRASDFTAFSLSNSVLNTNTAVTINYTLNRKSTSFSQDMTLKYGSTVIKSWNTTGTGALTQALTGAEVNKIISAMSTVTSGTLTLTMQTKSGSTNIGSLVSRTASVSLNAAIIPTASGLTVAIAGTGRDKTLGLYVQNISKVTASFSAVTSYGSGIKSTAIVVKRASDSGNSQTIANGGTTANVLSLSGDYSVTATVTDNRGRTHSISATITVTAYSPPSITTFTAARDSATTSNVNATIKDSWSPMGTSNPADITVVSVNNVGVSATLYSLTGSTAGSMDVTHIYTAQSDASSYTYTLKIVDSFGKEATAKATIGTTFVEMTIAKGRGVGIGKVWERGALDVKGDLFVAGGAIAAEGGFTANRIAQNSDINTFQKEGWYYCGSNADAATLINTPTTTKSFSLFVEKHAGIKQTITTYTTDDWYMWVRNFYGGVWGPWIRTAGISGSSENANGEYVRYSDGVQICWTYIVTSNQAISNGYGSLYQGTRVWTYPAAFIDIPTVECTMFKWGTGAGWGAISTVDIASCELRGLDILSRATGTEVKISAMAIGRWK